jgi:spore coat polysaccharide biosynthesis protein SpsF
VNSLIAQHDRDVIAVRDDRPVLEILIRPVGRRYDDFEVAGVITDGTAAYASNKLDRTFPIGVDAEAMTGDTLPDVEQSTTDPSYREHATKYIRAHPDQFTTHNVTVEDVFGPDGLAAGPELRLTLDEPRDYQVYNTVYEQLDFDTVLSVTDAIDYILTNDLHVINDSVTQKTL